MTLHPVNLIQIALMTIALLGVVLTVTRPRLRAATALLAMSAAWMMFNFLEETAGFRQIWLVTPAFRLAYPPLVYLLVRGMIVAGNPIGWRDWPHTVPFLVALALTGHLDWVEHAARLSLILYGAASLWLVHRFHLAIREIRSDAGTIRLRWLVVILAIYLTDQLFDTLRMDAGWLHALWPWLNSSSAYLVQSVFSVLLVAAMIVLAIRRATLFDGLRADAVFYSGAEPVSADTATARPSTEADMSAFGWLDTAIRSEALYSEPRLTRLEAAQASGLTERAVSRAIRAATGRNFNDYINHLRIQDVCAMMAGDIANGGSRRLIDFAFTAGFSSKSVFNEVFKREMGQTPSAYAATLRGFD